ncbi:MAG: hypothetical protein IKG82_03965 [Oscillospiraceae bacterium]|nr:hypothetical protein [Oscillospiraceae bacterium]
MMKLTEDYRKNVKAALKIMQLQRAALYHDVMRHYSVLYNGLHELDSEKVRALYFDAYHLEWLDHHWDNLTHMIQGDSKNEQREQTLFFASYFSELMQILDGKSRVAAAAFSELIKAQLLIVNQLIECSDEWDERSNQLQVNLKKHKSHYKKLIELAKAARKEDENGTS